MPKPQKPYCIAVTSLGCAKNLVDTEVICGTLATQGFALVDDPRYADMVLINTCSFIADARREAEEEIRQAIRWKRAAKPGRRAIAVAGCLPQREPENVARQFPEVDLFLGLDDVPHAATRIQQFLTRRLRGRNVPSTTPPSYLYDETEPRLLLTPPTYAFVKIAEGCDHRCAYCIIPRIRGPQRSRPIESVVAECRQLLAQDVREINLIAQDTTRYGLDRSDGADLPKLVRACDAIEGDFWIRILYTHPRHLSEQLLDCFAESTHLVPYLDMPLQHISSHILKAMHRGMNGDQTRRLLERIRTRCPHLAIRTTFLVGFPGETDDDVQELLDLVRTFEFDRLGVFAFSEEKGTPAASIAAGVVPPSVRHERRDEIMKLQREIARRKNTALVGKTLTVLPDQPEGRDRIAARTQWDAPDIDNLVHLPMESLPNDFLDVTVTGASEYDLEAVLASNAS